MQLKNSLNVIGADNIALGKQANQSSTHHIYDAGKAVNGNFSYYNFSHTGYTKPFWWMVDLQKVYSIGEIKLYNRRDCCRRSLHTVCIFLECT